MFFQFGQLRAQNNEAVNPEGYSPMELFMWIDCGNSINEKEVANELQKNSEKATEWFINFYEKGPSNKQFAMMKEGFENLYDVRKDFYEKGRRITIEKSGGKPKEFIPEKFTKKQFVKGKLQRKRLNLRQRSLEGLALLKNEKSISYLKKIAMGTNDILARYATELLQE